MIKKFLNNYLELSQENPEIVCLGGGVGTAQILNGLRKLPVNLTAVVSMADDGGSAGRVRRAFQVPPPGDIVNCLAALSDEESILTELFLYRFAGKRQGKDTDIGGQKLGNLIFVALTDIYKGDTNKALEEFSRIISPTGRVLPATEGNVNIWAKTLSGKKIYGEQNIDLGKYQGSKSLKEVHLDPENIKAYQPTINAIKSADIIIVGPGDLFSTVLPVLIVTQIKKELESSKAKLIYIVNIANKPFETYGFSADDYIMTLHEHVPNVIFDTIIINNNHKNDIPSKINYKYVQYDNKSKNKYSANVMYSDFVNSKYPLYHDSEKVADYINKLL